MLNNMTPESKTKIYRVLKIVVIVFVAIFIANAISDGIYRDGNSNKQVNTITLSGHGEVSAVPDIANVSFTIRKEAKTVADAQSGVADVANKVMASLKANNILDKDIKTESVSFNPKYDYVYDSKVIMAPCTQYGCPPRPGKNVITGYEAYESISVKIRKIDDTGKIIQELGVLGVTELSGPNFTIDNEDGLKAQAQKQAIDDAKEKAEVLAKNLGVRLGKITSFNDNGNYPTPMYATAKMDSVSAIAPTVAPVPTGENLISSDVTITYEIK